MFKNLEAILHAAGSSLERVLSANIFLVDPEEYKEFNAVYSEVCLFLLFCLVGGWGGLGGLMLTSANS